MPWRQFALVAVVGMLSSTQADTIYVNVTNCRGPGDGSEADPYCSIQTAIDNAVELDEIIVAPGTYSENINYHGKEIAVRSSGGPAVTTIEGQGVGQTVVMYPFAGSNTAFEGFTVTGGSEFNGGGMYVFGDPTVANCTFIDNTADRGGGMFITQTAPIVTDCTFVNNTATIRGGGMFCTSSSSPTVTRCTFVGNSAAYGGGINATTSSHPDIIECVFTDNAATYGGGIANDESKTSVFETAMTRCTLTGNTATSNGGGMYNQGAAPTVINCVFSGNVSTGSGGGIYNQIVIGRQSSPTLINCTFNDNESGSSGGAMAGLSPTVDNCILWNNRPNQIGFGAAVVTYSDVQGGYTGDGNIDDDPLFVDPGNGDLRLSPGSPCIDAADNTAFPIGISTDIDGNPRFRDDPATVDSGVGQCANVDMGAYEAQSGADNCCVWDLNHDGLMDVTDLLTLLGAWGTAPGHPPDYDGNGKVGVTDLLKLLGHWGSGLCD